MSQFRVNKTNGFNVVFAKYVCVFETVKARVPLRVGCVNVRVQSQDIPVHGGNVPFGF